ncbi:tail fiber domain-containing protein [Kordia sp. YSTF-M3]|uniref:Tail fiber domain-containing protein n=1 Tax=Kordia aestuariivivens TaxID=2759037 RepID=A0ABR7QDH5_9FLAO|nr:tail fiber domain-containing protein [Kordia aestuariivivens]MBC8756625.1 tail fiber domain-containing protein [Kordia aestuariivivens]
MKKVTLIFTLLITAICFAQNESSGTIATSITTPSPLSGETFRFGPGLVTQLDSGSNFDFNSRWFSFGRLNTGSQNVYGLRFQLPNRALTMGYQDLSDINPRLQWIGAGSSAGTDFEFRVADSFTSTASTLVATMTNDGKTYFGNPLSSNEPLVGMDYSNLTGSTRTGLIVQNTSTSGSYFTGIKVINDVSGYVKTGIDVKSGGSSYSTTGINSTVSGTYQNTAIRGSVNGTASGGMYGVSGFISSTATGFGAAIYGSSSTNTNRYAGYFNGNVVVTGTFTASDERLKENVKGEKNVLDKLAQLDAVTYTFKENDQLNLPSEVQHGFLAQNIEQVFPELVTTINKPILDKENNEVDSYEYKAVNYVGLISVLTSSIQELNEEVTSLRNELEEIKGEGISKDGNKGTIDEVGFSMEQNIPNPFNNQATISYTLPSNTKANIAIFDMSGKFIREYDLPNQKGELVINSSDIGQGMFIYSLVSGGKIMETRKMIVK